MRMRVSHPRYSESVTQGDEAWKRGITRGSENWNGESRQKSRTIGLSQETRTWVRNPAHESGTSHMSQEPRTWVRNPGVMGPEIEESLGGGENWNGESRRKSPTIGLSQEPRTWVRNPAHESGTSHMSQEPRGDGAWNRGITRGRWKLKRWVTTKVANHRFESGTPHMSQEPRTWVRNPGVMGPEQEESLGEVKTETVSHDESRQPQVWVKSPAHESGTQGWWALKVTRRLGVKL